MILHHYCLCGGTMTHRGDPAAGNAAWALLHDRPECGPATQQQAARARERSERALEAEWREERRKDRL